MSKAQLKKEIAAMTADQLREVILDAYSARKEIKEYFDYFVNPDPEKLYEKVSLAVAKELDRSKRGHMSKARISYIKKLITEFEGYQPGLEKVIDLRNFIVAYAMLAEMNLYFSDTLFKGIAKILCETYDLAAANLQGDTVLEMFNRIKADPNHGTRYFRNFLESELSAHLAETAPASLPK